MKLINIINISGYRKWSVAILAMLLSGGLLVCGYDVSKISWLSTPLAAFFAADLLQNLPEIIQQAKNKE